MLTGTPRRNPTPTPEHRRPGRGALTHAAALTLIAATSACSSSTGPTATSPAATTSSAAGQQPTPVATAAAALGCNPLEPATGSPVASFIPDGGTDWQACSIAGLEGFTGGGWTMLIGTVTEADRPAFCSSFPTGSPLPIVDAGPVVAFPAVNTDEPWSPDLTPEQAATTLGGTATTISDYCTS